VDIATWPWASRFAFQQIDLDDYPNVRRRYLSLADRPAFQRG
jgi:GST-like protein